ncbi:hypothetical protein D3C76_545330 [compost metagenome]
MEGTVTGVRNGAVRLQYLEETTAVDRHVQRVFRGLQAAGLEVLLGADNAHTSTDLQAGRQLAVLGGLRAWLAFDLVQQVLEFGAITLEAGGRDVGQVVGDDRQVGVLCGQAGFSDPESRKHLVFSSCA